MPRQGQEFVDSQRPGWHISTFLRQLAFELLYVLEYVVLLGIGLSGASDESDPDLPKNHYLFYIKLVVSLYVSSNVLTI